MKNEVTLDGLRSAADRAQRRRTAPLTTQVGTYVHLFMDSGQYDLVLAHRDMATFESKHRLSVQGDAVFVKVYSQPISTDFDIVNALPADFTSDFRPAFP